MDLQLKSIFVNAKFENMEPNCERPDILVKDVVVNDYRTAEVLSKYGIDYCCGGKKSLRNACLEKEISYEQVLQEIEAISYRELLPTEKMRFWDLGFLCDYIVSVHHAYDRDAIRFLLYETEKVALNHKTKHPETEEIRLLFIEVANHLLSHMEKEEKILYPFIRRLNEAYKNGNEIETPAFGSIANPILVMEHEHEQNNDFLSEIRKLTSNYNPPDDACMSYRVCYAKLKEFEDDLLKHAHIENNILFERAKDLELALSVH